MNPAGNPSVRDVRAIRVLPETLAVDDGDSARLVATVFDQVGVVFSPLPAPARLGWTSSAPGIATVDSAGLVRGVHPGAAQVTAAVQGTDIPLSLSAQVVVKAVPTGLAAVSGDSQTAAVGTRLPQDLLVKVTDRHGDGVPGIAVGFALSAGRGALTHDTATTDSTGQAGAGLTLDTLVGPVGVAVTAARLPAALVHFHLAARPGPTSVLAKVAGDAQTAVVGTPLPVALVVRLADRYGNVTPGVTVAWQATAGGGTLTASSSVSDSLGRASTIWTLGATTGAQAVQAAVGSTLTVAFAATATPVPVATVVVAPDTATVPGGQTRQFAATTKDAAGNVLAGRAVTWTSSDTTIASVSGTGLATARRAGGAVITATSEGKSGTAALTVVVGAASTAFSTVSVSASTVAAGGTVALTLQARDAGGNNLTTGGRTVLFTLTGGTSTGTVGAVTDRSDGTYTATFTAGSPGTPLTVGATIDGVAVTSTLPTIQVTGTLATVAPVTLSAGVSHACEIRSGGATWCWGGNAAGQLGDGSTTNRPNPVAVAGGLSFVAVSAGDDHTCGLTAAGVAYCWGGNGVGQLGTGTTAPSLVPTAVSGGLSFDQILAGSGFSCALSPAGVAYCWGANGGKLGDGNPSSNPLAPQPVSGGHTYTSLALFGNNHACGVATGGTAYCWGYNGDGAIGDGSRTDRYVPTAVSGSQTFATVASATYHSCALTAAGAAWCWGDNNVAQLGYGTPPTDNLVPGAVQGGYVFTALTAGDNHTCGLQAGGTAVCWGYNADGALGDATIVTRLAPAPVVGGLDFIRLAAGASFTCGQTASSGTWCWGLNTVGQLGNSASVGSDVPVPVGQAPAATITVTAPRDTLQGGDSEQLTAAVRDGSGNVLTGRIVTWSSSDTAAARVDATGLVHVRRQGNVQVSATAQGVSGSVILRVVPGAPYQLTFGVQPTSVQTGQAIPLVKASARDSVGNLVNGFVDSVVVTLGANPGGATLGGTAVAAASNGTAVYTDLTVSAPGVGYTLIASSVGLVSAISAPFTVTAPPLLPMTLDVPGPDIVATGRTNLLNIVLPQAAPAGGVTVTVTSDATGIVSIPTSSLVFAAGETTRQIAIQGVSAGATTVRATAFGYGAGALPVSVVSAINAVRADTLAVGTKSACQLRAGQLYCWGNNAYGQLGDGTTTNRTVPTKAAVGYAFVAVSVGSTHACGLTAGGTAYCWGDNSFGALGAYCYNFCGSQSSTPIAVDGGVSFAKIRAGYWSTCGLTVDGAIYCWGYNGGGQLGVSSGGAPGPISSTLTFGDVAVGGFAGYGFSCGLTIGGTAYCWGDNRFGGLGDSTTNSHYLPQPVVGGSAFAQLASGYEGVPGHTCALTASGAAYCWGGGQYGALGFTTVSGYLPYPGQVTSAPALSSVTAGGDITCGLDAVGAAWCWGKNVNGALGDGTTTYRVTPGLVSGGHTFSALRAGTNSVCGFTTAGELWCWGSNNYGQIGDGTTTERDAPVLVTIPEPVATVTVAPSAPSIVVGASVQLAATPKDAGGNALAGRVVTWTSADTTIAAVDSATGLVHGRAVGSVTVTATSEGVSGAATVTVTPAVPVLGEGSVSAGYNSTCDVRPDLTLNCWGDNTVGKLGNGNSTAQTLPATVSSSVQFMQVAAGYYHTCALAADSTAYCWGHGFYGALGNGGTSDSPTPTPVSSALHFAQIVSGYENSCARTAAGDVWCWGHDGGGDRLLPVQLTQLPPLAFISERFYFVCGLTADGQAYCWGSNGNGNLGNGTSGGWVAAGAADTVIGNLRFTSIATGSGHACGIATSGTVYCWGDNSSYQLGTNGPQYVVNATPAHIQGAGSFTSVYAGFNHTCVLAADGTARCWGTGNAGQLGDGDRVDISSGPGALVTGGLKFSVLTLGNQYSCGRTLDGKTYCWGSGGLGQLGIGSTITWYDPQLVH